MKLLEAAEAAAAGAEAAAAAAAAAAAKSSSGGGASNLASSSAAARRHFASPLATFGAGVLLLDDTTAGLGTFLIDQAREWDASAEAAPGRPPVVPDFSAPPQQMPPSPYFHRSAPAAALLPAPSSSSTPSKPSAFGDDEEWGAAARVRDAVAAAEAAAAAWGRVLPQTLSPPSSRATSPDDGPSSPPRQPHPHPPLLSADFELAAVRALRSVAEAALPSYGAVVARERARRAAADAAAGGAGGANANGGGLRNRRRSDFDDDDDDDDEKSARAQNDNDNQTPRFLRRARPADVSRYRGDWMLRPVQGNEVSSLVRPLVRLSVAANEALGLTPVLPQGRSSSGSPTPASASSVPPKPPSGLGHPWLDAARDTALRRGLRVNLRPLAERAALLWLLWLPPVLFLSVGLSLRVAAAVWEVLTAPYEPGEWERRQQFEEQVAAAAAAAAAATMTGENE